MDNILDKAELLVEVEKGLIEDWAERADSEFLNAAFGEPEDEPDSYVLSDEAQQNIDATPASNKDKLSVSDKGTVDDFRQYQFSKDGSATNETEPVAVAAAIVEDYASGAQSDQVRQMSIRSSSRL